MRLPIQMMIILEFRSATDSNTFKEKWRFLQVSNKKLLTLLRLLLGSRGITKNSEGKLSQVRPSSIEISAWY